MNIIYIFQGAGAAPSFSPFCSKVVWMAKRANFPCEIDKKGNPRMHPSGKLPILKTDQGIIAGSDQIQAFIEKSTGHDFDASLSAAEKIESHAFHRLIEESYYFMLVRARWLDDRNFEPLKVMFEKQFPFPMNKFLPSIIRNSVKKSLKGHGIGRMGEDEVMFRAQKDIDTLSAKLGDKPYLMGSEISSVDYVLASVLASIDLLGDHDQLKKRTFEKSNVRAYSNRVIGELNA